MVDRETRKFRSSAITIVQQRIRCTLIEKESLWELVLKTTVQYSFSNKTRTGQNKLELMIFAKIYVHSI